MNAVPPEVAELLVRTGDRDGPDGRDVAPSAEELAERALLALDRALGHTRYTRSREAAWDLLAADALLTCACETALDASDPEAVLEALVSRVAADPGPGEEAGDRD